MTAASIITLRETLEASLIVGIILAYLNHTKNSQHSIFVWMGVLAGIALSVVLAIIFQIMFGDFTGRTEELYEGITMLTAAALITWMILWMLTQRRSIRKNIENDVEHHLTNDHPWGLFTLALVATAREGIETVIFLKASILHAGGTHTFIGGLLGIVIAVFLSVLLFRGIVHIPLKKFFSITSVLLILFAAGLVTHGVHEFEEAGLIPSLISPLWNMNGFLDEAGTLGSFLKGLFGYNGNPSLMEVMSYGIYLMGITAIWKVTSATAQSRTPPPSPALPPKEEGSLHFKK